VIKQLGASEAPLGQRRNERKAIEVGGEHRAHAELVVTA
jgi:hypothetical protein